MCWSAAQRKEDIQMEGRERTCWPGTRKREQAMTLQQDIYVVDSSLCSRRKRDRLNRARLVLPGAIICHCNDHVMQKTPGIACQAHCPRRWRRYSSANITQPHSKAFSSDAQPTLAWESAEVGLDFWWWCWSVTRGLLRSAGRRTVLRYCAVYGCRQLGKMLGSLPWTKQFEPRGRTVGKAPSLNRH